jgi:tRNA-Thr(GGU) m(6)t(6)A37 methyltransferase TsaA
VEKTSYTVTPIGAVESTLMDRSVAPKQAFEGAPDAWITVDPALAEAAADIRVGDRVVVVTWFDRASRDVLRVHPRNDVTAPETGVFSTRSPDRPNPIGLHVVEVLEAIDGTRFHVDQLEAIDGTPVLDLKPQLRAGTEA